MHVEPDETASVRERAQAAALSVPRVREVHNINVLDVEGRTEVSLHLKLPGELRSRTRTRSPKRSSARSARGARRSRRCRRISSRSRRTSTCAPRQNVDADAGAVLRIVRDALGREPRELRFLQTNEGIVAFLTLGLDPANSLADAHTRRARSRRASAARDPRSPTSSSTPSREAWSCSRRGSSPWSAAGRGRCDGDIVVQLAAQTLEAFFTGGGLAREHNVYPLADVALRAPVLRPPSIRFFEDGRTFAFGNTASMYGPQDVVPAPAPAESRFAVAAVIGDDEQIAGYTLVNDWRAPSLDPPKDRDFATSIGPWVETDYVPEFDSRRRVRSPRGTLGSARATSSLRRRSPSASRKRAFRRSAPACAQLASRLTRDENTATVGGTAARARELDVAAAPASRRSASARRSTSCRPASRWRSGRSRSTSPGTRRRSTACWQICAS